eukprot:jgi/Chlat1/4413/Chrsp29S04549
MEWVHWFAAAAATAALLLAAHWQAGLVAWLAEAALLVPAVRVAWPSPPAADAAEEADGTERSSSTKPARKVSDEEIARLRKGEGDTVPCYDPATFQFLGTAPALTRDQVSLRVWKAREAQQTWSASTFTQRRHLLRILLKSILENQEDICRAAAIDSGKPMVDAALGEILVTCEKIRWLLAEGERWLQPERRSVGAMMLHKVASVEYHPLGVIGAIVPWNYPFHNIMNPLLAAVFAGNAIVIKVSEYASWSSLYYARIISAALEAAGAPTDLVQVVTGYATAGRALVTSGVDQLVFVGSTEVGKKVLAAAAETLTPVVLELGGKDPFIVCNDANLAQVVPIAMRAAFQACGQNCAGAERFIVQESVYEEFMRQLLHSVSLLRQGLPLDEGTDCGALCMPGQAQRMRELVDDAVALGAKLHAGGKATRQEGRSASPHGQFFPPTVLSNVLPSMRVMKEEVFGPIVVIIKFSTDDEAVRLSNDTPFGLGSSVFSGNKARAKAIASRLGAGMTSINDFNATYVCQSLPFGGVGASGFGRFGGVEGLRGVCRAKAVAEDRFPLISTNIPRPIQYPVSPLAFPFVSSLIWLFFHPQWIAKARAVLNILSCMSSPNSPSRTS